MKFLFFSLAALITLTVAACGGGTEIKLGQLVSDTITESDANDDEWKSKTYVIDVREGVPYTFDLTTLDDDIVGIWSADAGGYIVEVNLIVTNRTVTYTFSEGGSQKLFLQSPADHVPSPFTFKVSAR